MKWDYTWMIELVIIVVVFFIFGYVLGVNYDCYYQ
jgi:hypothetical protein